MTFIHPFDDPLVIAGQGTIGAEILRHSQDRLSAVFVPVGGGGLIAGIAGYIKALRPDVKIIGVEPFEADAMYRSLAAGRRVRLDHVGIFADGVAVREVGELHVPDRAADGGRDRARHQRRDLRRDQGHLRRHAHGDGAGRRAGRRRPEGVGRARGRARPVAGRRAERRQHELRSAALRRRARRGRRGARGAARRHHPGASGRVPRVLRGDRPPRRHRVQLPAERPRAGAHLRRRRHRSRGRTARRSPRMLNAARLRDRGPDRQRDGEAARPPHGGRPRAGRAPRAAVPVRVPRAPRRADRSSSRSSAAAGTSACSTTAITAPTSAACSPASRSRTRTCRRSARSSTSSAIRTRPSRTIRRTGSSWGSHSRQGPTGHGPTSPMVSRATVPRDPPRGIVNDVSHELHGGGARAGAPRSRRGRSADWRRARRSTAASSRARSTSRSRPPIRPRTRRSSCCARRRAPLATTG